MAMAACVPEASIAIMPPVALAPADEHAIVDHRMRWAVPGREIAVDGKQRALP